MNSLCRHRSDSVDTLPLGSEAQICPVPNDYATPAQWVNQHLTRDSIDISRADNINNKRVHYNLLVLNCVFIVLLILCHILVGYTTVHVYQYTRTNDNSSNSNNSLQRAVQTVIEGTVSFLKEVVNQGQLQTASTVEMLQGQITVSHSVYFFDVQNCVWQLCTHKIIFFFYNANGIGQWYEEQQSVNLFREPLQTWFSRITFVSVLYVKFPIHIPYIYLYLLCRIGDISAWLIAFWKHKPQFIRVYFVLEKYTLVAGNYEIQRRLDGGVTHFCWWDLAWWESFDWSPRDSYHVSCRTLRELLNVIRDNVGTKLTQSFASFRRD